MDIIKKKKTNKKNYREYFSKNSIFSESEIAEPVYHSYKFEQIFDVDDEISIFSKKPSGHFEENIERSEDNFLKKERKFSKRDNPNRSINNKFTIRDKNIFNWMVLSPIVLCIFVFGSFYVKKGVDTQKKVLGVSKDAYNNINLAIDGARAQDFNLSSGKFEEAYRDFSEISQSLEKMGTGIISIARFIPGASKLSSGYYLTEAAKELSLAGDKFSKIAQAFDDIKNNKSPGNDKENVSILEIFTSLQEDLKVIKIHIDLAQSNIDKVKIIDIPKENQEKVLDLKTKLPLVNNVIAEFSNNSNIISDFLGANGPRKYLFLFQNNQEMRATGGFIGSYGVLDIDGRGRIRKFFIDGIFNPDGQLTDKIIPPKPIQKISAAWSLHDSNWFPDFPLSAKKAISFYERTGGPTVDGVITLTPTVMQKFLAITGPIEMPEYGVTLTKDNFIENIQYEVEENYDKEENKPKKILSDLAPIMLDKLSQVKDAQSLMNTLTLVGDALREKHILLYFSNEELQKIISELNWSGEISPTEGDYLSVVNTNISGYKTDGVVKEKIKQQVNILKNGDIVNTVTINRKHMGGNFQYEWWNKVNSDYMRVYVPRGSILLEVEGQTREINKDVLDYQSLNFDEDEDVKKEETQMEIDAKTGTRVYNDANKTVFANWVYVSPQEEVNVKYKYLLPFKFREDKPVISYSFLSQKQSGSLGDEFEFSINYPNDWKKQWESDGLRECESEEAEYLRLCQKTDLVTDKFMGVVFDRE